MASALIDTNLLLLLVVGITNKEYIQSHKRTRQFDKEGFFELEKLLSPFSSIWITSHCLAETSNLLKQTNQNQANELLYTLSKVCEIFNESHRQKSLIFTDKHYLRLGVADTGFLQKAKKVSWSFTADHDLYQSISSTGSKVVNFHHVVAKRYLN